MMEFKISFAFKSWLLVMMFINIARQYCGAAFRHAGTASNSLSFSGMSRISSSGTATLFSSFSSSTTSYGTDMDQEAMMESDVLIAVGSNDELISSMDVTKKKAHLFSKEGKTRGILHRAFSVFLFDNQNRMLVTKRASSKITFPGVWTNTCCSHPLRNMKPDEVDDPSEEANAIDFCYHGVKHAARRKLLHELGIDPVYIPHEDIQFITKFHYWAADTLNYGTDNPPWGEHEVDYILFFKHKNPESIPIFPCEDEVEDYRYVTQDEFKKMLKEIPAKDWSPWFRGFLDRGFWQWWDDLDHGTLTGKHSNNNVTFFDPPKEYYASANYNTSHNRQTGTLTADGVLQS